VPSAFQGKLPFGCRFLVTDMTALMQQQEARSTPCWDGDGVPCNKRGNSALQSCELSVVANAAHPFAGCCASHGVRSPSHALPLAATHEGTKTGFRYAVLIYAWLSAPMGTVPLLRCAVAWQVGVPRRTRGYSYVHGNRFRGGRPRQKETARKMKEQERNKATVVASVSTAFTLLKLAQ